MPEPQEAKAEERAILENADLFMLRPIAHPRERVWTGAAVLALAVLGVEIGVRASILGGALIGVIAVFVAAGAFRTYRFSASFTAAQVRLAGGLLLAAASFAAFGPRAWLSIAVLLAVGAPKLAREAMCYARAKRRMAAIGKTRRVRMPNLVPGAFGLVIGAAIATSIYQGTGDEPAVSIAAWMAGYSLTFVAMELWA
jgi:hypothetical protein